MIAFLGLIILLLPSVVYGQACQLPILSSFSQPTKSSVQMQWLDFNSSVLSYEIEFGEKGFAPTQIPSITDVPNKTFMLTGLESGTAYEVYIRTECPSGLSGWNGPYFFNTVIDNNSGCGVSLAIADNRCPLTERFQIEVAGYDGLLMGRDIVLDNVELLIAHPWPPDLNIELWSPYGEMTLLSRHNGSGANDYGDTSLDACAGALLFSDSACEDITSFAPPFVGIVKPEAPLSDLYSDNTPNGIWELRICDRANGDLGILQHLKLSFTESACLVPPTLNIADIEADNITVVWQNDFDCQTLELAYKRKDDPIQLSFSEIVLCSQGSFTIPNLNIDEEYEMVVTAQCGITSSSPESCVFPFRTACANSTIIESFENVELCEAACEVACPLTGIWNNANNNVSDWIVNQGETPTRFTGPESGAGGSGQYIYIENQVAQCPDRQEIMLISDCLSKPQSSACALSFSYNMFGNEIGKLSVEYSTDSLVWNTLWSLEGNQGTDWFSTTLDLPVSFERGLIRFVAEKESNVTRGDIAIDKLKLIGIETIEPLRVFVDADEDGYGDSDRPVLVCSSILGFGFAFVDGDCDDENPLINPGVIEILCNQIDENCNGPEDDAEESDIGFLLGDIQNASCLGQENAAVTIQAVNGQPPYSYNWSDGQMTASATNLAAGVYFCTITDFGGCQLVTDPIIVDFDEILVYSVRAMESPTCFGANDGLLELLVEGGTPPYRINWNSGDQGNLIGGLSDGVYKATITDGGFCSVEIDSIILKGPDLITGGVILKRDNSCFNDSSGFIQLGIFGGTPPYDILWSTGATTSIINGLPSGIYASTITDQNGCLDIVEDILIEQPEELSITLNNIENISCFEEDESLIDISVTGGTTPYGYFWSDGSNLQDLINQPSGSYVVTVTDVNSCTVESTLFDIAQPAPISAVVDSILNVNCIGSSDGFLSVDVSGGNGPFDYNWSIQDGQNNQANALTELSSGSYSLTVVDAFDCKSEVFSFEVINQSVPISLQVSVLNEALCFGDSTGQLTARALNGELPLDYNWSSGEKTISSSRIDTLQELIAGAYNLTVTDSEGCTGVSDSIRVSQPTEVVISSTKIDNLCFDEALGSASIAVDGGIEPYNVHWSNDATGTMIDGLINGNYVAQVTDDRGCINESQPIAINSPEALSVSATIVQPMGVQDGMISLDVSGGIAPISFTWPAPYEDESESSLTNLPDGSYAVTITDGNNCTLDTLFVLQTTAVSEAGLAGFNFYPNPAREVLHISGPGSLESVELFSLNGQLLSSTYNQISNWNIDLTRLPVGLFYARCILKDGTVLYSDILTKL